MLRAAMPVAALLLLWGRVEAAAARPTVPPPSEIAIGRHTFFDFGPPNTFYEIILLRAQDGGTSITRAIVTPPGLKCIRPASVEVATAHVGDSLEAVLGGGNPCSIPENALRTERKRCKGCMVFSGVDVVMQAHCGGSVRRIRMDILDRDLFDRGARTPAHTSWTMGVLGQIDAALGHTIMERPMLPMDVPTPPAPHPILEALARGEYDALVGTTPGRLAVLLADSRKVVRPPSVTLSTTSPFRPVPEPWFVYPEIPRLARVEGEVAFRVPVDADGRPGNVAIVSGPKLLELSVKAVAAEWRFPPGEDGRVFEGTLAFRMNCDVSEP